MCYAYPGPRCTSHAYKALVNAIAAYSAVSSFDNFEKLKNAQADYDMTPGGQRELLKKIMKDGDPTGLLNTRLTYGQRMRELSLAVIKSEDKGDNDTHAESFIHQKAIAKIKNAGRESAERLALIQRYAETLEQPGMEERSMRELSRIKSMLMHPTTINKDSQALCNYIDFLVAPNQP